MKHIVAMSGSYNGNPDALFKSLHTGGILQMSLIGREVTLQLRSENMDEVKDALKKIGVDNLNILEWKKAGVTLSNPGKGVDNKEIIMVSLIPSALDEGLRPLAFLCEFELDEEILMKVRARIEEILDDAGLTDAIYTIHIKKETDLEEYLNSTMVATLNALFEAGGVASIDP